jgi:hypothetical protein
MSIKQLCSEYGITRRQLEILRLMHLRGARHVHSPYALRTSRKTLEALYMTGLLWRTSNCDPLYGLTMDFGTIAAAQAAELLP